MNKQYKALDKEAIGRGVHGLIGSIQDMLIALDKKDATAARHATIPLIQDIGVLMRDSGYPGSPPVHGRAYTDDVVKIWRVASQLKAKLDDLGTSPDVAKTPEFARIIRWALPLLESANETAKNLYTKLADSPEKSVKAAPGVAANNLYNAGKRLQTIGFSLNNLWHQEQSAGRDTIVQQRITTAKTVVPIALRLLSGVDGEDAQHAVNRLQQAQTALSQGVHVDVPKDWFTLGTWLMSAGSSMMGVAAELRSTSTPKSRRPGKTNLLG